VYENEDLKLMMIEYCNGNTLQNYIERKGRIPEKEAILIFKQILNGIAVSIKLYRNCILI
jgi:serine/threonine protein kinase